MTMRIARAPGTFLFAWLGNPGKAYGVLRLSRGCRQIPMQKLFQRGPLPRSRTGCETFWSLGSTQNRRGFRALGVTWAWEARCLRALRLLWISTLTPTCSWNPVNLHSHSDFYPKTQSRLRAPSTRRYGEKHAPKVVASACPLLTGWSPGLLGEWLVSWTAERVVSGTRRPLREWLRIVLLEGT